MLVLRQHIGMACWSGGAQLAVKGRCSARQKGSFAADTICLYQDGVINA